MPTWIPEIYRAVRSVARRGARWGCLVAWGAVACGRVERAQECHRLATIVNPALDAVEAQQQGGGAQTAALQRMAARYDQLAVDLGQLSITDRDLNRLLVDYAQLYRRAAHLLRQLAEAQSGGNEGRIKRLRAELDGVARREQTFAKRIQQTCHAP